MEQIRIVEIIGLLRIHGEVSSKHLTLIFEIVIIIGINNFHINISQLLGAKTVMREWQGIEITCAMLLITQFMQHNGKLYLKLQSRL